MTVRGLLGSAAALAAGLLSAGLVGAGAFALQMTLRRATPADEIAVKAMARLEPLLGVRAVERLSGVGTLPAACSLNGSREIVRLPRGERLVVLGARVRKLAGRRQPVGALAAEADLAGCPRLLSIELGARLLAGKPVLLGTTRVRGRPAYRLRLGGGDTPWIELDVARGAFTPLVVRFRSRLLSGRSELVRISRRPV